MTEASQYLWVCTLAAAVLAYPHMVGAGCAAGGGSRRHHMRHPKDLHRSRGFPQRDARLLPQRDADGYRQRYRFTGKIMVCGGGKLVYKIPISP